MHDRSVVFMLNSAVWLIEPIREQQEDVSTNHNQSHTQVDCGSGSETCENIKLIFLSATTIKNIISYHVIHVHINDINDEDL